MKILQATKKRITALDALRGFALLGILIMNTISHSSPGANYLNPFVSGDLSTLDYTAFLVSHLFANQKFISLFSILFGAGVILFTDNIENKGRKSASTHYIRSFWLLIFGLFHAYVIWSGDILVQYAMCAVWLYWFRKMNPKTLYIIATILFLIAIGFGLFAGLSMPYWSAEEVADLCKSWQPSASEISAEILAFQGSWSDHFPYRSASALALETLVFVSGLGWQITALMLIGMGLFKTKVLTAERSLSFYKKLAAIGISIGLIFSISGIIHNNTHNWSCEFSFFLGSQYSTIGSLPMALGYIGLFMWWFKTSGKDLLTVWLAPLGRMALTNYLMQSIIATFIFYGYGFGLFGTLGRAQLWFVILGIWIFQILFSKYWMRRFYFGPFEWLWRSLTYWKIQPFKK